METQREIYEWLDQVVEWTFLYVNQKFLKRKDMKFWVTATASSELSRQDDFLSVYVAELWLFLYFGNINTLYRPIKWVFIYVWSKSTSPKSTFLTLLLLLIPITFKTRSLKPPFPNHPEQWFPNFLILQPYNTVPYVVMTSLSYKIIFAATSKCHLEIHLH